MKKKYIFILTLAFFVPLAVFAEEYYGNIVGCGIQTIPQFIKAIIGLMIKIGIPIGSIFFIWSGFLFLTAQGDAGKLESAKKTFFWTCIGFGVLLASWLLSIGFLGIITAFTGGQGQDATLSGACGGDGGPPPGENLTIPPIPPHETQKESAPMACSVGGFATPDWVMERAFNEYFSYRSWVSKRPLGTAGVDLGPVGGDGTEDCLYEQGVYMTKIQANRVTNEQGWFYVIGTNGKNKWQSVGKGTSKQISVPLQDFQSSLSGAQGLVSFHTHPQDGLKNNKGQTVPSSGDIFAAGSMNSIFGSRVQRRVSDSAIDLSRPDAPYTVWAYDATNGSLFISQTKAGIGDGWDAFTYALGDLANKQKDQEAIRAIKFFQRMAGGAVTATNTDTWLTAAWTLLDDTASGSYGPAVQKIALEYGKKIEGTPLFAWWDTYRLCSSGEEATNRILGIYADNGVTVREEQHPYMSCLK